MIPFAYTFRNLRARWVTTLMTILGTALVVAATIVTFGLTEGIEHALKLSGEELDVIVLRQAANDETSSGIDESVARELATLDGIARDAQGNVMCSAEFVTILTKSRRGNGGTTNVVVRGLEPIGRQLRPGFKIVEGRDVRPGVNELITSRSMAARFENLGINETLTINRVEFTVVGYFEAAGSSAESEVWGDIRDITAARREQGTINSVTMRAQSVAARDALIDRIEHDEQFKLKAVPEPEYFANQMSASVALKFVGYVIGVFLTVGAMFGAANTMYAAVASRKREIGTLRALGFNRLSILTAFLRESVVLCLLGGLLGCLATLPFHGLSSGTANWQTFSEITFSFRFGPAVLLRGVIMALVMGLLGGLAPAIRAVRLRITDALRA